IFAGLIVLDRVDKGVDGCCCAFCFKFSHWDASLENQGSMVNRLNPSFALGTIGYQPVASLNLRFETRWLRVKNITFLPASKRHINIGGRSNHLRLTVCARIDASSRRCSGSSSTMS